MKTLGDQGQTFRLLLIGPDDYRALWESTNFILSENKQMLVLGTHLPMCRSGQEGSWFTKYKTLLSTEKLVFGFTFKT